MWGVANLKQEPCAWMSLVEEKEGSRRVYRQCNGHSEQEHSTDNLLQAKPAFYVCRFNGGLSTIWGFNKHWNGLFKGKDLHENTKNGFCKVKFYIFIRQRHLIMG